MRAPIALAAIAGALVAGCTAQSSPNPRGLIAVGAWTHHREELLLMTPSGKIRSVAGGEISGVGWSADGLHIAFGRFSDDKTADLLVSGTRGSQDGLLQLTPTHSGVNDRLPAWSPDGRTIAFTRRSKHTSRIYAVTSAGRDIRALSTPRVRKLDYFPKWSPDGRHIAFLRGWKKRNDLVVMDVDGSNAHRLTHDGHATRGFSWSPNSRRIVFARDAGSSHGDLYIASQSGGTPTRITHDGHAKYTPAWQPHGDLISFTQRLNGQLDIFAIGANGGGRRRMTTNTHRDIGPTWSPDGRFIAYLELPRLWPKRIRDQKSGSVRWVRVADADPRPHVIARGKFNVFPISWQPEK